MACKKGFLCRSLIERKGYCISTIFFFHFNPKICKMFPWEKKKSQKCKTILSNSHIQLKTANEPYTILCFNLQSCVRLYKLGCKWLTALLTARDIRVKAKQNVVQNSLLITEHPTRLSAHFSTNQMTVLQSRLQSHVIRLV